MPIKKIIIKTATTNKQTTAATITKHFFLKKDV